MTMIDVHQDTRDLHLQGVTAHRLALVTAALRQGVMSIPTYLEVVAVATIDRTTVDGVAHLPSGEPYLGRVRLPLLHRAASEKGTRSLPGLCIVDQRPIGLLPPCVADMIETKDQEVQGAVTEQDPSHLQIPLAHDLPEDLGGGAMHQSPHVAVLRHLGVDVPLHPNPGLILVH